MPTLVIDITCSLILAVREIYFSSYRFAERHYDVIASGYDVIAVQLDTDGE